MLYIFWILGMLGFKWAIVEQCQCILWCVRILLAKLTQLSTTSETLSYVNKWGNLTSLVSFHFSPSPGYLACHTITNLQRNQRYQFSFNEIILTHRMMNLHSFHNFWQSMRNHFFSQLHPFLFKNHSKSGSDWHSDRMVITVCYCDIMCSLRSVLDL